MATARWTGGSLNRRQVDKITMSGTGDWVAGDTVTCTIDNVDFVITIGTLVTDAQVATTVFQALTGTAFTDTTASATISTADGGGQSIAQFSEVTAANATAGEVSLTANGVGALAGKPFTMTAAESSTGDDTAVLTSVTVPTSQYHANQADNYHLNTVVGNNDTLVFDNGSIDMRYGLALGTQPLIINKTKQYTGNVGLPEVNADNTAKLYHEYRTPTYLTMTDNSVTTVVNLETGTGQGSGRFKLDSGAGITTMTIFGRGPRAETGVPSILWKGSAATNTINNIAGDLGVAWFAAKTAAIQTLRTGDQTQIAETYCTSGVGTITTVICSGGKLFTSSAITAGTQTLGEWQHNTGTITALTVNGGSFYPLGGATITTLTIGSSGKVDCTKGNASFTVTNTILMYKGAELNDPNGRTGNTPIQPIGCGYHELKVIRPNNKIYTPS